MSKRREIEDYQNFSCDDMIYKYRFMADGIPVIILATSDVFVQIYEAINDHTPNPADYEETYVGYAWQLLGKELRL